MCASASITNGLSRALNTMCIGSRTPVATVAPLNFLRCAVEANGGWCLWLKSKDSSMSVGSEFQLIQHKYEEACGAHAWPDFPSHFTRRDAALGYITAFSMRKRSSPRW